MKEVRITLETAKLLKEKKFEAGIYGSYTEYLKTHKSDNPSFAMEKGEIVFDSSYFSNNNPFADFSNKNYTMYAAPTQALVQKWLREIHNIQVYAVSGTRDGKGHYRDYVAHVCQGNLSDSINDARDEEYDTYEKALEAGLKYALNLIK